MSERLKLPPERDFRFYQRRKHDKWRPVEPPVPPLESPVADSHAHVHMLPDPAWELARCAANGVRFVCEICDPTEDALAIPDDVRVWQEAARSHLAEWGKGADCPVAHASSDGQSDAEGTPASSPDMGAGISGEGACVPAVRIAAGVHPHNASRYDGEAERRLLEWLAVPETTVLGEVGLDFHYDLSPRDVQRSVFRRQIELAKELGLPVSLHLRGGGDPVADDAHGEAFGILQEAGFPEQGTILHCCALPPDGLLPWIEAGCYVAYGGALTFKNADAACEGAHLVPEDRLLLETDSPYMAPEPMRGAACTPAHVVFTAARLAEVRGIAPGPDRKRFLDQLFENARRLLM